MSPIHEIAFLVLSGPLACWTYPPPENPCPNADSIKIAAYEAPDLNKQPAKFIDRRAFQSYQNTEVGYEENGFAVYEIRHPNWFQIRNNTGQKFWLNLAETNKRFQLQLSTGNKSEQKSSWRVEKLERLIGHGLVRVEPNSIKHLKKEDLKTPLVLTKESLNKIHDRQLNALLKETKSELPTRFVDVILPCTQKEISPGYKTGTCEAPPQIIAYTEPNQNSARSWISMTWANWAGKAIPEVNMNRTWERLYIFSENNGWLKIQITFGDPEARTRWIKTSDLKRFKIHHIPQDERVAALIQVLNTTGRSGDAEKFKDLSAEPGFKATGKTKWSSDGVLWGEVSIQDLPACTSEEPKTLTTGWLPYKLDSKSPPIVSWYSRGC